MSYAGKLLIARPGLSHPLFAESVIYVCQDLPTGSTGIILNKPLDGFTAADVCEEYNPENLRCHPLYCAGPLKPQSITMLHTSGWWSENTIDVGCDLSLSSDEFMLEKLSEGNMPDEWRLFAGVCMWEAGQLESEISGTEPSSWLVLEPKPEYIFLNNGSIHWDIAVELYSEQMVKNYF